MHIYPLTLSHSFLSVAIGGNEVEGMRIIPLSIPNHTHTHTHSYNFLATVKPLKKGIAVAPSYPISVVLNSLAII